MNSLFQDTISTKLPDTLSGATLKEKSIDSISNQLKSAKNKDTLVSASDTSKKTNKDTVNITKAQLLIKNQEIQVENTNQKIELAEKTTQHHYFDTVVNYIGFNALYTDTVSYNPVTTYFTEIGSSQNLQEDIRESNPLFFSVPVLIIIASLISFVRHKDTNKIKHFVIALINDRFTKQLLREDRISSQTSSFLLGIVFILTYSIFFSLLHFIYGFNRQETSFTTSFMLISTAITLFFITKIIIIRLSGLLLNSNELVSEYIYNVFIFNSISSIIIIPLVIFCVLNTEIPTSLFLNSAMFIVSVSYIFRSLKIIYSGITSTPISGFYIFLYICVLEILPLVVLVKILYLND